MLRFTVTPSVRSVRELHIHTLNDIGELAEMYPHKSGGSKTDTSLILPVSEWTQLQRCNTSIKTFGRLFLADFDGLDEKQGMSVIDVIVDNNLQTYLYTTFSHMSEKKKNTWCFRVVVELSQEYAVQDHGAVWDKMNVLFLGLLDPKTKNPQIPYYLPLHPIGTHEHIAEVFWGQPLNVGELSTPTTYTTYLATPVIDQQISFDDLRAKIIQWSNYRGRDVHRIKASLVAKEALRLMDLKPPKNLPRGEGRRHEWMLSLAGMLAREFPLVTSDSICSKFPPEGWLKFSAGDSEHSLPRLQGMIDDFQAKELEKQKALEEERAEKQKVLEEERAERQQTALKNIEATSDGRSHFVTPEEVLSLDTMYTPQWRKFCCLYSKDAHWLMRVNGEYWKKDWSKDELLGAAEKYLAVFGEEILLGNEDPKTGEYRQHSLNKFKQLYATPLDEVVYDQTIKTTAYDRSRNKLSLACAQPAVEPIYHDDVHQWLSLLGGDLMLDITAGMSRLQDMLPAVVITGPGGCGKTLYSFGVAGIWGRPPNASDDSHSRFSADQMIHQPITLHDEKAGIAYRKEGSSLLRRWVTERERWVEAKYRPKIRLIGFPRLIFCGNNTHLLDTEEDMSEADRDAFAERLIHIQLDEEHSDYLRGCLERTKKDWIGRRHLSEHCYWLGLNWEIQNPGPRFLVCGPQTHLHNSLAGGSGLAAEVIQWLLSYVANPRLIQHSNSGPIEINRERHSIRVSTHTITKNWGVYLSTPLNHSTNRVGRALSSISRGVRQKMDVGGDKTANVYEIKLEILRANLDRHHLTEEDFEKTLGL